MVRNTVGGEKLSAEMVKLLARLVYGGYLLFPSAAERSAAGLILRL
jgi:hypothetical protein